MLGFAPSTYLAILTAHGFLVATYFGCTAFYRWQSGRNRLPQLDFLSIAVRLPRHVRFYMFAFCFLPGSVNQDFHYSCTEFALEMEHAHEPANDLDHDNHPESAPERPLDPEREHTRDCDDCDR